MFKLLAGLIIALGASFGLSVWATSDDKENAFIPDENYKPDMSRGANNFYQSDLVNHKKVSFKNIYNMKVVGNLYTPKTMAADAVLPAIVVGHPMGAVKEQSASLYAQKMAEKGFVTLAIDLSFWGESAGKPRNSVLPDVYSEDFSAAVDYLSSLKYVDKNKIGVIGICGSGSFAISAAKIDSRIKAIATVSMYNMGNAARHGLNNSLSLDQRKALIDEISQKRTEEFGNRTHELTGGTVDKLKEDSNQIEKEFYDFYRTKRGACGDKTSTHPTLTSYAKFLNFYPFEDIESISPRAMLFITGDWAHSKEFSEDAYNRAAEPKEIYYVNGVGHTDLYDRVDIIPFDKLDSFFKEHLN